MSTTPWTLVQSGMAKSGNFWLYRILQMTEEAAGIPHRSFIQGHQAYGNAASLDLSFQEQADTDVLWVEDEGLSLSVSSVIREPVTDIAAYARSCSHIWTHSPWCDRMPSVLEHASKCVYIVRDPRDVAISLARFSFTDYMLRYHPHGEASPESYLKTRLYSLILSWVRHTGGYVRHAGGDSGIQSGIQSGVHIVFYERLKTDFQDEYGRMVDYLGVDVSQSDRDRIEEAVAFENMRKDNPGHVRQGTFGKWRETLDAGQIRRVERMAGPMLELLGYPLNDQAPRDQLPRMPEVLDVAAVEAAVRHSRGNLLDKAFYAKALLTSGRSWQDKLRQGMRFLIKDQGT